MDNRTPSITILKCRHTVPLYPRPNIGDEMLCSRCGQYREVIAVTDEVRWRCADCGTSRGFGTDEHQARRDGAVHAAKMEHKVKVQRGRKVIAEYESQPGQGNLIDLIRDSLGRKSLPDIVTVSLPNGGVKPIGSGGTEHNRTGDPKGIRS